MRSAARAVTEVSPARVVAVVALALLGNAYMFGVAIAAVAGAVALVWFLVTHTSLLWLKASLKLAAPLAALAVGVTTVALRTLFVKLPDPRGLTLAPQEAPGLFAEVRRLAEQLRAPVPERILLVSEFNAAVVQLPRFGPFPVYRSYLILGLPTLLALEAAQLRPVLAHELGHLARGHGRIGSWVYRTRLGWAALLDTLERAQSLGLLLFLPFLRWFLPRFESVSYPLAKQQEYEADRASAELCGAPAAGGALVAFALRERWLQERLWGPLREDGADPSALAAPLSALREAVSEPLDETWARRQLLVLMQQDSAAGDTHPALRERLAALDVAPALPSAVTRSAADHYLGPRLPPLLAHFDAAVGARLRRNRQFVAAVRGQFERAKTRGAPIDAVDLAAVGFPGFDRLYVLTPVSAPETDFTREDSVWFVSERFVRVAGLRSLRGSRFVRPSPEDADPRVRLAVDATCGPLAPDPDEPFDPASWPAADLVQPEGAEILVLEAVLAEHLRRSRLAGLDLTTIRTFVAGLTRTE